MKDLLANAWFNGVIKTLVERIPLLNKLFALIDGHKATIGRVLMFVSALLAFLHSPQGDPALFTQFPILETLSVQYMAIVGWLMTELGLQHDVVKKMESEGVVEEHHV